MTPATIGGTGIHSMTVIDATADCVAFDDLETHPDNGDVFCD